MEIVIEGEAAAIVERLVATGRFGSAREAVEDALRRAGENADENWDEPTTAWMRARVEEAEIEGGEVTLEELDQTLDQVFKELEKEYP